MHVWRISILDFLIFEFVSCVVATGDGIFISRTAYWHIVGDDFVVLIPTLDRLARWIEDLVCFPIFDKMASDRVLAKIAFCLTRHVY